jgi:flavin reductase (DIM6/NTAB) family NADH-FMN oxidoreductase RutF
LKHAYRLLNHGPTVIVSAAHAGRRNLMAAAWAMPLDFDPPKVAVVIDKSTYTRALIEGSGEFALQVPCASQADMTFTVGSVGGAELDDAGRDKFDAYGIGCFSAERIRAPLVAGCVGWLECRLIPWTPIQQTHDLFLGEVVAAQADPRVFSEGRWHFERADDALRTIHHLGAGLFPKPGDTVQGQLLSPLTTGATS